MIDIDNRMKLLFSAFIVILLGVVLIQPVADDVQEATVSSITITNETLSFAIVTTAVSNESQANTDETIAVNYTLSFDNLTLFTEVRNESATIVTSDCNVSLGGGIATCNMTNSTNLYFDYTYVSGRTETLANDELLGVDAIRNETSSDMIGHCNVTLSSGELVCNNTHHHTGFIDYRYEPDTYVHSSAARTMLTLTILFFALLVLAIGIGYVVKSFREGGIM